MSDGQIAELPSYEQSDAYSDLEKLILRFAVEWARQTKVPADLVDQLTKRLSPSQMVILSATVALANWTNKFNETFAIELP